MVYNVNQMAAKIFSLATAAGSGYNHISFRKREGRIWYTR